MPWWTTNRQETRRMPFLPPSSSLSYCNLQRSDMYQKGAMHSLPLSSLAAMRYPSSNLFTGVSLPLVLLLLVVLISISYRFAKQLKLSREHTRLLIVTHAFATEGIQLTLATLAFANAIVLLHTALYLRSNGNTIDNISATQALAMRTVLIALSSFSVYAVDFIESRVQLGTWKHSYETSCFVITRNVLFSTKTVTKQKQAGRRKRALSKPNTKVDLSNLDTMMRHRLRRLAYLDLAVRDGRPMEKGGRNRLRRLHLPPPKVVTTAPQHPTPDTLASTTPHRTPTSKINRRVSWALTRTLMLPCGTIRRQSMP